MASFPGSPRKKAHRTFVLQAIKAGWRPGNEAKCFIRGGGGSYCSSHFMLHKAPSDGKIGGGKHSPRSGAELDRQQPVITASSHTFNSPLRSTMGR